MSRFRKWFETLACTALLAGGYLVFVVTGKTPTLSYHSMVKLFCLTRGRSNDWLSRSIGFFARRYRLPNAQGVLGDMEDGQVLNAVTSSLRERGFHVFERRLPDDVCDRLIAFATSQPAETYAMDGQTSNERRYVVYDRERPRAVRYEFKTEDLLANPDIQRLLADLSFAAVAQEYLGSRPVVDVLSMWWLTGFSNRPDAKAAQYFHFDMDRPKWLKFFIHLTDVTPQSGPHMFVAGSHRTGAIPDNLLQHGYSRLTDEQVAQVFAKENVIEFTAPRGCIVAEDTRGLHKGKHIEHGDRLMLQIQFSNSLFGADYPKTAFRGSMLPELESRLRTIPELYAAYL